MKKPPYTERRGNQWWYRRRAPTELVPVLGFAEYRESLRTSDIEVARTRAAVRNAEVEVELQAARATLRTRKAKAPAPLTLSPANGQYIREAVRAHLLSQDELVRMGRPDLESLDAYESVLADHFEQAGYATRTGRAGLDPAERSRIHEWLRAVGIEPPPEGTEAWEVAAFRATEGALRALQDVRSRMNGEWTATPAMPVQPQEGHGLAPSGHVASPQGGASAPTLGAVIDRYLGALTETQFTRKIKLCLYLFGEVLGRNTPVSAVRQLMVTDFLKSLPKLPADWKARHEKGAGIEALFAGKWDKGMGPRTYVDNYRSPLGTFLRKARRDHRDEGFPELTVEDIEYIGKRPKDEEKQRALTVPELKTLLEGPVFSAIATDPQQEELYWFTLISLFTGARPREVCQINPQVDCEKVDEHHCFRFSQHTAAGKGIKKSVKTDEERVVPLHAELVRLGLPAYLERIKDEGADRLFPGFRVKGGDPYTAAARVDFTALLKEVGLYDNKASGGKKVTGAYTMRKTFITQCFHHKAVSRLLTGHAADGTTEVQRESYITEQELVRSLVHELGKLTLPLSIPLHTRAEQR